MATMDDIARHLGVSKSTVSKALSGAEDVSAAMRKAVLEKAVELGYSKLSRNREAPRLAIFVTHMAFRNPQDFGYDLILGFRKMAEPAGYQVDVIPLDPEFQENIRYDEYMMLNHYLGGLFLGLCLTDPWLKDFSTCRTPAVLYDNHVDRNARVTYVGVDNVDGMEQAVAYLHRLGHYKIGYLSGSLESYIYRKRRDAFFLAMSKTGLACSQEWIGISSTSPACVAEYLPRLLDQGCTALVCSHDRMAREAMDYCRQNGLRIPEDISILGYDDDPLCPATNPPLTSIRQNRTELGKSAFYAMTCQLAQVPLSTLLLHADLICRDSCAEVPNPSQ